MCWAGILVILVLIVIIGAVVRAVVDTGE